MWSISGILGLSTHQSSESIAQKDTNQRSNTPAKSAAELSPLPIFLSSTNLDNDNLSGGWDDDSNELIDVAGGTIEVGSSMHTQISQLNPVSLPFTTTMLPKYSRESIDDDDYEGQGEDSIKSHDLYPQQTVLQYRSDLNVHDSMVPSMKPGNNPDTKTIDDDDERNEGNTPASADTLESMVVSTLTISSKKGECISHRILCRDDSDDEIDFAGDDSDEDPEFEAVETNKNSPDIEICGRRTSKAEVIDGDDKDDDTVSEGDLESHDYSDKGSLANQQIHHNYLHRNNTESGSADVTKMRVTSVYKAYMKSPFFDVRLC
jgi:hypothetical protein